MTEPKFKIGDIVINKFNNFYYIHAVNKPANTHEFHYIVSELDTAVIKKESELEPCT